MFRQSLAILPFLITTPASAQLIFESGFENDVARADVQWAAETQLIDGEDLDALTGYDPATGTFTFDSNAGLSFSTGDVLLVAGTGLGRVDSVFESGGTTTVTTTPATLADAIESGRLLWNLDFGFEQMATAKVKFGPKTCSPTIDGMTVSFECGFADYTLTMQVTGGRTQSTIKAQVVKGVGDNATASFIVTGTIGQFNQQADVDYAGGELDRVDINNNGLQLNLTLEAVAAGAGDSNERYEVPFPIFTIPFNVGPVPMSVDIGASVLATLQLPLSAQAQASAKADFSYNADTGLVYDGSSVEVSAQSNAFDFSNGSFDSSALLGVDFVEATFGMAVPRVTLNVLGQEVAYVLTGAAIRSIFYTGPICKEARTILQVQAGYGLSILGIDLVPEQVLRPAVEQMITSTVNPGGACPQSGL